MGVSATIVPTLVPIESEIKQAAINSPARSILPGRKFSVKFTVASMLPISFALLAKAPAKTEYPEHQHQVTRTGAPAEYLDTGIDRIAIHRNDGIYTG
jgi:hypothetical protein